MFSICYFMTLAFLTAFFICFLKMGKKLDQMESEFSLLEHRIFMIDHKMNSLVGQGDHLIKKFDDLECMFKEIDQGVQFLIDLEEEFQKDKEKNG